MSKALEGLRVVDFSWVVAGPLCVRHLADFGAQVVHVETSTRVDPIRYNPPYKDDLPGLNRSGYFHNCNSNKYGITLNLRHPKARDIARRLVLWSDVVVENFRPGTMKRLGLSYDELRHMKPDIIMISLSSQGQSGPNAQLAAFGIHLCALSGFTGLTGWPDRNSPTVYGAYTDSIAARFGAAALLAALDYRRRTGKGQYIDLSQYEAGVQFLIPPLLDYEVNGRVWERNGNRDPMAAPHGAYRCQGEDRWCALAVSTDDQWGALCWMMGNPRWTKDAKFATLLCRKRNEDELDSLMEEWTISLPAEELAAGLQEAGVPAAVVATAEDVHRNPQLKYRKHFSELDHQEIGRSTYDGLGSELSRTPSEMHKAAHVLGEDNYYVYTQVLQFSDEEFVHLLEEGVLD